MVEKNEGEKRLRDGYRGGKGDRLIGGNK